MSTSNLIKKIIEAEDELMKQTGIDLSDLRDLIEYERTLIAMV